MTNETDFYALIRKANESGGAAEEIDVASGVETLKNARLARKSGAEKWGFFVSPVKNSASDVKVFSPGSVRFDASLAPFYAAVVPLLEDYHGSGDYAQIFSFAPEAVKDLIENITTNRHSAYFRARTFRYCPPNKIADAHTIDSNQMRYVQTGATLSMSFALLKISADSRAEFYFGFQGNHAAVENLLNAIASALEAAEFVAEKPR